jgi:GNAT superfamily N-acetyltransferase
VSRYAPIGPLTKDQDRSTFDCGSADQTRWFRQYALQAQQADTARVFVACRRVDQSVAGYYALSAGSVEPDDATARLAAGTGGYPVPVVILARLGVDLREQGRGLGRALLRDALLQVAAVSTQVGVRALLVHAESPGAARFYTHFDPAFEQLPGDPLHLVLLLKNIRAGLRNAAGSGAVRDRPVSGA